MLDIDNLIIHSGHHKSAIEGHCVLEVVSMLAGEPWRDHPACVCPVVGAFARRLNDAYGPDDEGRTPAFRPLVRKLMGTRGTRALELRRMFAAADAAVRVFAPLALDARKQPAQAEKLRAVPEITDKASAIRARDIALEVRAASAADYAAAVAAYAAASAADYAAAAADYAAAAAAYDAASSYAASAASAYAASASASASYAAASYAAASAADYAAAVAAYAASAYAIRSLKIQARRDALAHGITLLAKLCDMKDEVTS